MQNLLKPGSFLSTSGNMHEIVAHILALLTLTVRWAYFSEAVI